MNCKLMLKIFSNKCEHVDSVVFGFMFEKCQHTLLHNVFHIHLAAQDEISLIDCFVYHLTCVCNVSKRYHPTWIQLSTRIANHCVTIKEPLFVVVISISHSFLLNSLFTVNVSGLMCELPDFRSFILLTSFFQKKKEVGI